MYVVHIIHVCIICMHGTCVQYVYTVVCEASCTYMLPNGTYDGIHKKICDSGGWKN